VPTSAVARTSSSLRQAAMADWYTDIHFQRDCYMGLSLAAQHTRRLLLGPRVSEPYSRHPAQIASAIATLDDLSGGRAQLGLGIGTDSGVGQFGIAHERPVRALRESIENRARDD